MSLSISAAARVLREGGLVAFPTETVYGLGADARNAGAVARIFELKGRPPSSPLIVHAASIEMAARVVSEWPPLAEELARRHWPGPLTLVLPKAPEIPDIVTAGLPTVGVRMPAHPIALRLIQETGFPIAAPSANRFTGLSPTTAEHVREAFGDAVPVLDGGPCKVGIESTVVSLAGAKLTLLRPGMIAFDEIEQGIACKEGGHPAPGMHPRHYSPRTPLLLIACPEKLPDRHGAYLWWKSEGIAARTLRLPATPAEYAACLYAALHQLDRENWPWIAVETPPETPAWAAIQDRLKRAAGS
jgi:L-threonylcarbamoyladenylate synthase